METNSTTIGSSTVEADKSSLHDVFLAKCNAPVDFLQNVNTAIMRMLRGIPACIISIKCIKTD